MDDKKLAALATFHKLGMQSAEIYLWLSIPGGLLTGKPIEPSEYFSMLFADVDLTGKTETPQDERRFYHLKNAVLIQGNNRHYINLAIIDPLEVSAWGLFDGRGTFTDPK